MKNGEKIAPFSQLVVVAQAAQADPATVRPRAGEPHKAQPILLLKAGAIQVSSWYMNHMKQDIFKKKNVNFAWYNMLHGSVDMF